MANANSKRIFHDATHRGPTGGQCYGVVREWNDDGTVKRYHAGVDYGADAGTIQYSPFDGGIVKWVGYRNSRGYLAQIHYPQIGMGLILQHASEILVTTHDHDGNPVIVNKNTPIVKTGKSGGNFPIHAHVEFFTWDGTKTVDQQSPPYSTTKNWDTIDLAPYDIEMTEEEAKNIIRDLLDDSEDETTGSSWAAKMWREAKIAKIRYDERPQAVPTREQVASMILRAFAPSCRAGSNEETEV